MFKFFIKLLLLALIALVVLPFISINGKPPLLKWSDLKMPSLPMPSSDSIGNGDNVKFYKWQDAQGQWHMSNTPPPDGINAKQLVINPNANVLPAVETPTTKQQSSQKAEPKIEQRNPLTLSNKDVKKVMEAAKNVQKLVDDRQKIYDQF